VSGLEKSRKLRGQRSLEFDESEEFLAVSGAIFGYNKRSLIILALPFDIAFNDVEEEIGWLLQEPITFCGCIHRLEDLFILIAEYAASRSHKPLRQ